MIDINRIRNNPEEVRAGMRNRNTDTHVLDTLISIDERWRAITKKTDEMRAELKVLSNERAIERAKALKEELKKYENDERELERQRIDLLYQIPNIPDPSTPIGPTEKDNKILRIKGKPIKSAIDYLTVANTYDLIDVERSSKVAGSRFGYLKNEAALLEFALIQFAFNRALRKKFIPIVPPVMVNPKILAGIGKGQFMQNEDAFYLAKDNLYLAGSAEHTIAPMHSNEVLSEDQLPLRYIGFSTCFRREAGSYGRDTKGILRVHQFDKVELFSITKPEDSMKEHDFLVDFQESLLTELGLPYRVVQIATGDMGFGDAKQIDIETWIPSENTYRETNSASNTTDFQSRGVNIKYLKRDTNTKEFVHMLNATGFAIGRMLIAIFENCQTKKGTIKIPKPLVRYSGIKEIKAKTKRSS